MVAPPADWQIHTLLNGGSDLFTFPIHADEDFLARSREGREKKVLKFNSPSCLRAFA